MKTDLEKINSVQHRLKVHVAIEDVNQGFDQAYASLKNKVTIQGFRKGHAPLGMIKKMYADQVQSEVSENLVRTFLPRALQEKLEGRTDLRPASYPMIDNMGKVAYGEEFEFSAIIDVLPDVEVKDYKGLKLSCFKADLVDNDVEKEIERIQKGQAKAKAVSAETPIAKGQLVTLSYQATDVNTGAPVPAECEQVTSGTIGEGELPEYIDAALVGKKAGDTFELTHTFGTDHIADALKGKTLKYEVNVQQVQQIEYPKIDDELAKDIGLESLADLKGKIKENLSSSLERNRRSQLEEGALNQLLEKNPIEVPPSLVEQLINDMIQDFPYQRKEDKEKAMKNRDFRERLRPSARRRAQNTLLLWQVAQNEGISITDDDVKNEIKTQFGMDNPKQQELDEAFERVGSALKENMTVRKAMDAIIGAAKIEEKDPPKDLPKSQMMEPAPHVHGPDCNHDHDQHDHDHGHDHQHAHVHGPDCDHD